MLTNSKPLILRSATAVIIRMHNPVPELWNIHPQFGIKRIRVERDG